MRNYYNRGLHVGATNPGFNPEVATNIRSQALSAAIASSPGAVGVLVSFDKEGNVQVLRFASFEGLMDGYNELANRQDEFAYVAAFNTTGPEWPHEATEEFGKAVLTIAVRARGDKTITQTIRETHESAWGWVAAGLAGIFGLMAVSSKKRHH